MYHFGRIIKKHKNLFDQYIFNKRFFNYMVVKNIPEQGTQQNAQDCWSLRVQCYAVLGVSLLFSPVTL